MTKVWDWVKNNKILTFLVIVFAYFLFVEGNFLNFFASRSSPDYISYSGQGLGVSPMAVPEGRGGGIPPVQNYPPQLDAQNRKVVTDSYFSLLVESVVEVADQITAKTEEIRGYVVNTSISRPTEGGAGTVIVRIPLAQRDSFVEFLRDVGVRVVSENTNSQDVTDQYTDIEGRLATLQGVKARYEQILTQTTDVDQILNVQQKIFQVQDQIDALIGQRNYINAVSNSTLITINLSTDELALPYSPEDPWRPGVVFKLAVRAMLSTLQNIGSLIIWLAVYAVIWVPALLIVIWIKRYLKRRQSRV